MTDRISRSEAIAAVNAAFAQHAIDIKAANGKRGGGITMAGHDMLARAERGREVALNAIVVLGAK